MITVYQREINGKKGEWTFHSMYVDNLEGGKHREKEYAENFNKKDLHIEYKVKVENNPKYSCCKHIALHCKT